MTIRHLSLILFTLSFLVTMPAYSIDDRADTDPKDDLEPGEKITWKSTASRFADSLLGDSFDLNVRGNTEHLTFWIGHYSHNNVFMQTRLGLEYSQTLPIGRLLGSYQVATGDFKGWSLTWDSKQSGKHGFSPLLGIGRTNLKPYYNLSFDPNDSVLMGGSYSASHIGTSTFYTIYDDRLHTGQQTTHVVWRRRLPLAGV